MRAVVYEAFGAEPEVREVADPAVPPAGAVIGVEATGLCRSDWHGWMGRDPDITAFPHVPGHELSGVVEAVGPEVTGWRPGDRVMTPFVSACGRCGACVTGDQQVCERQTQPGFTHWGSFAERVAIDHADVNLVGLPDGMGFPAAASLGCRFATAFRAVVAQGRVRPGDWLAVHGCGGVGLSAVMIGVAAGARVVAVDVSPAALDMAARLGAAVQVRAASGGADAAETVRHAAGAGDVAEAVREATGGGAHVSIDALGSAATCVASVGGLRRRGRHVQVGLLPGDTPLPMGRVIAHELEIVGSHGMAAHAYPAMLEMIAAGTLRPDLLVTRTVGLEDVPAALAAMGAAPAAPGITMIAPGRPPRGPA
ncbi:alcohol dehydrogenase catalytic domain-containing protein [Microbispora sp. ATCC PTA-5024]|uniref:alcohol dehydrogenase catalytic domain-containing protein n=1 Tax=Microbispora sp. ATCC PTA-5024 TaxID=316330 RepID=UPI0003DC8008|nr:alcohol dehydrogenase catalytic domain-containing protein [Microbispora sp. ATCC PTA-5024]ETK32732.1 alcohol dehydrogenase [Microbispora sp. ATCC PTA-5024]